MDSARLPISVTIITLNEERHLERALRSVRWADEVIVVDCGSQDGTQKIATDYGARFEFHRWDGYGQQKNYAQSLARNSWVLNIDADEEVTPELESEMRTVFAEIQKGTRIEKGFYIPRKSYYLGRWVRYGGWYPNYLMRFADRRVSRWTEPEVHEALQVDGSVSYLKADLNHYTFSSIEENVRTNLRFSRLGSRDLIRRGQKPSLLKLIFKPLGKFLETYVLKKGCMDGIAGFLISVNAAHSMFLKYAYLFETYLNSSGTKNENSHY